jgi:predicted small secreted protein
VPTTSNRRFWLVAGPMFGVGIAIVVLILVLRPSVRRNAAILVEGNLRTVATAVERVRETEGSLAAVTPERMTEEDLPGFEFNGADEASDEPAVISVAVSDEAWTGAARADSGACYWIRVTGSGETLTGTIPGEDCTGATASRAEATGWPDV